jgi:hypothetical protein
MQDPRSNRQECVSCRDISNQVAGSAASTLGRAASRLWRGQRGESAIVAAVGMAVIIAFCGLAVDMGNARYTKRKLQAAADAAALAGALELRQCAGQANCSILQTAAGSAVSENGIAVAATATQCGSTGSGLTLIVNNGPCLRGGSDPNYGNPAVVEASLAEVQPTVFGRTVGFNSVALGARAEATLASNPNCVYALDQTGGNAITVDLLATVNSSCGWVDESSAWNAFSCNLLAYVSVSKIAVDGGVEGLLCGASPSPTTGVAPPTPRDPLAYIAKPAVPACGSGSGTIYHGSSSPLIVLGTATLYPDGAYCGGITLLPTANVTFMPGTYVICSGGLLGLQGGLTISLASQISGQGVTFYNYGPLGGVTFLAPTLTPASVSLTAPTSGTYAGMLFMQDPQNVTPAILLGTAAWHTTLEGAFYFPSAPVTYLVSGGARYNILVAKDIEFLALTFGSSSLASNFNNDYSGLQLGSPLLGGAVLVQ